MQDQVVIAANTPPGIQLRQKQSGQSKRTFLSGAEHWSPLATWPFTERWTAGLKRSTQRPGRYCGSFKLVQELSVNLQPIQDPTASNMWPFYQASEGGQEQSSPVI